MRFNKGLVSPGVSCVLPNPDFRLDILENDLLRGGFTYYR